MMPQRQVGLQVIRIEFKRFVNTFIQIPCLIIRTVRRICYNIIGYNEKLKPVLSFFSFLKAYAFR